MRKDVEGRGGEIPGDELPEQATERKNREELLRELISIPRLEILEETEEFFTVKLGEEEFHVAKSSESSFTVAGTSGARLAQRLEIRQVMLPDVGIFQDEEAPKEFKEVMILHEIREMEYKKAGFQDAHKRAMQDEVLYILKYFKPDLQQSYLEFARKYREITQKSFDEEIRFGPVLNENDVDSLRYYFFEHGSDWAKGFLEDRKPSGIVLSKLRSEIQNSIRESKEAERTEDRKFYKKLSVSLQELLKIFQDYLAKYKLKES
jgi:hypothetical protein